GFGQEERHLADFERHNAETQMRIMRSNALWRTILPLVELLIAVTIAAVIVYGAREAVGGGIEVGLIVSFTAYLRQALAPLPQLTVAGGQLSAGGDRAREARRDPRRAAGPGDALEVFERLPNGLSTEVGERGEQLSGGQRQLVSLARATIIDPRILVLDEAASSIDVATEARVQRGLARLLAGRTSLVIA